MNCSRTHVEYFLKQWALWSRRNVGISLGFPSIEPYAALITADDREPVLIQDATAIMIDRTMAEFLVLNNFSARVTISYFCTSSSYSNLGRIFGCDHKKIKSNVDNGVHYFMGVFNGLGDVS